MATCECGEDKHPAADACNRCAHLDGGDDREGIVIAAMRQLGGPSSVEEIADVAGYSKRSAWYALAALEGIGRVNYAYVDDDEQPQSARLYWLTEED